MPSRHQLLQSLVLVAYFLIHVVAQVSTTTSKSLVTSTTGSESQSSSILTTSKSHTLATSKILKSSTLALTTNSTSPPSIAPTGDPITNIDETPPTTSGGLVNYFFIFLALILCVVGLGTWLYFRARKRAAGRSRNSRSNALARDLGEWPVDNERWRQRRHWMSGHWRSGAAESHNATEEGLNEEGEAPPPYIIKTDEEQDEGLRRPESAVVRERYGTKPPEYHETFVGSSSDGTASIEAEAEEEEEEGGRRSTAVETAGRERNESRRRNLRFGPLPRN